MVMVPSAQRVWPNPDAGRGNRGDRAGPEVRLEDVELVQMTLASSAGRRPMISLASITAGFVTRACARRGPKSVPVDRSHSGHAAGEWSPQPYPRVLPAAAPCPPPRRIGGRRGGIFPFDAGHMPDALADWCAARHDDVPGQAEAAGIIYDMRGRTGTRTNARATPARRIVSTWRPTRSASPTSPAMPIRRCGCCRRGPSGASSEPDSAVTPLSGPARPPPRSTASSFVHHEYEESVVGDNKAPFRQE